MADPPITSISAPLEVLMVCTGNICRSPMAEGLLRQLLPSRLQSRVTVSSAGTHALVGRPAEPHARTVMSEWGIDIRGHRARQSQPHLIHQAALVLTMELEHQGSILSNSPLSGAKLRLLGEFGPDRSQTEIPDPYGQGLYVYRACARLIRSCLPGVIREVEVLCGKTPDTSEKLKKKEGTGPWN
ncbi:MAG: low molecular weight protein-tyrosine-phosphatase [Desulfobacterales bacterium]